MSRSWSCGGWAFCLLSLTSAVFGGESNNESRLQAYYAANGFLQRGLFDLAAAEYRTFLRDNSEHEKASVARYGLAVCLFRTHKSAEAAAELDQLSKVRDFAFSVDVLTMLGQCRMAAGDHEGAASILARVVDEHADHRLAAEAGAQLAEALLKAGKPEEALARCKAGALRWPASPQMERWCLIAATAELNQERYEAALPHLRKMLTAFPQSANRLRAMLLLGQCNLHLNQLDEAVQNYREVLRAADSPWRPEALYGLAAVVFQKGEHAECGSLLDELIEKHPDSPLRAAAYLLRGRAKFESKALDDAVASFDLAGKASADSEEVAAYWIAKCELRQGKYKEAARRLKTSIATHSKSRWAAEMAYDRTVALSRAGETENAQTELRVFLAQFNTHALVADALELLATLLHQAGKYEESEEQCDEFLRRFAGHARAATILFIAGENEFLRKRYAEAAARYRKFLDQFPKDEQAPTVRYRLGMSLQYSGKPEEAAPLLAEAAERGEGDERVRPALYALATAAFERGEWKKADELFTRYLAKATDRATMDDAMLKLGLAQVRQDRADEAVRTFDRLISSSDAGAHRMQAIFERGQALLSLKRSSEAKEAFEAVLSTGSETRFAPYARNHLASLAMQAGELGRAEELLAAVEKAPELAAEAMFNRGKAQVARGQFKSAAVTFKAFLKANPEHALAAAAKAHLGIALSRDQEYAEALRLLDGTLLDGLEPALRYSALYERAWSLRETGKGDEAATVYRQLAGAADAGWLRMHAVLELASHEAATKKFDKAIELLAPLRSELKQAKEGEARSLREQVAYRFGIWHFEAGRHAEASDALAEFAATFARSELASSANYYAGEAFFQIKKFERAAEHIERALTGDSKAEFLPSALLRLGETQAQLQRWRKSEETFEKYLREFRDREGWYQAVFGVGWARENQGRHDEAIKAYREVVEKHKGPTAARAQFQIGECLFARNQYEDAVRELLKVDILYDYPEWSAAALYEAGRCFEKVSKLGEARQQFKTVSEKYSETQWAKLASQRLAQLSTATAAGHAAN